MFTAHGPECPSTGLAATGGNHSHTHTSEAATTAGKPHQCVIPRCLHGSPCVFGPTHSSTSCKASTHHFRGMSFRFPVHHGYWSMSGDQRPAAVVIPAHAHATVNVGFNPRTAAYAA